ncbi:MAG: anti-sigma factor [Candidatus Omnitrophica bacterium]|nr:anti-sigma factor [Candidatus Omnitrophota bacterium]
MNCERIQELILTDYLDGRMADNAKKHIEEHLCVCPDCLQFAKAAKKTAFDSFEGVEKVQPPDHVWARIEEAIVEENGSFIRQAPQWLEYLKALVSVPRPVFALATVLILFLGVGTLHQVNIERQAATEGSMEYLVSLTDTSSTSSSAVSDFGTSVEQYFL